MSNHSSLPKKKRSKALGWRGEKEVKNKNWVLHSHKNGGNFLAKQTNKTRKIKGERRKLDSRIRDRHGTIVRNGQRTRPTKLYKPFRPRNNETNGEDYTNEFAESTGEDKSDHTERATLDFGVLGLTVFSMGMT